MTSPALRINRDKLYGFLKDHEMVVQFENLFQQVDESTSLDVDGIANEAGDALAKANSALYQLTKKIDDDYLVELGNVSAKANATIGQTYWKRRGSQLEPKNINDNVYAYTATFGQDVTRQGMVQLTNDPSDTLAIIDVANFADQGNPSAPIGWQLHHYTDGAMAYWDNVGDGNTLTLNMANNSVKRPDKPANYVGTGRHLVCNKWDTGTSAYINQFAIDNNGDLVFLKDTQGQIISDRTEDGTYGIKFEYNDPHESMVTFSNGGVPVFGFKNDTSYTRALIESDATQTNGIAFNAKAGNLDQLVTSGNAFRWYEQFVLKMQLYQDKLSVNGDLYVQNVFRHTVGDTGAANCLFVGGGQSFANTATFNTAYGAFALANVTSGGQNSGICASALRNVTTGSNNLGYGVSSLFNTTTGFQNAALGNETGLLGNTNFATYMGHQAGYSNNGPWSVFVGHQCGYNNNSGVITAVGRRALYNNLTGTEITALGYQSGYSVNADGGVYLGYQAGYSETNGRRLYIADSNTTTPLIYGEFDNRVVKINGSHEITDSVKHSAVETITASSDTLDATNYDVNCDCTSNNITINLPASSGNTGLEYNVTKIDATGNTVTISPNGSETVNGAASTTITSQYTNLTLVCDGSNWIIK